MTTQKLTVSQKLSQLQSLTTHATAVIFTIAFVAVFVSTLNQLAMLEVTPGDILLADHLKQWVIIFGTVLGGVFSLIFMFVAVLSRKTIATRALREKVVKAYQQALDDSSFNPHPLNKRHERLNSKNST